MVIGSVEMTVSLPNGKIESISKCCQKLLQMEGVTVRELSSFLGILNSTVLQFLPAPSYIRYLYRKQLEDLCATKSFDNKLCLDHI